MQPNRPPPKFALHNAIVRHTPNLPMKEVFAGAELSGNLGGAFGKLAAGTPIEQAPTFLQELAREKTLARK